MKKAKVITRGLVGKFFHSINAEGKVEWQGYIASNPEPGWYVCQLFEWFMGEQNVQRLVKIEEMHTWLFYKDSESMKFSYDQGVARPGGPYRDRIPAT